MTIDEAILGALEEGAGAAPYAVTLPPEVVLALVAEVREARCVPWDGSVEAARLEEIAARLAGATPGPWSSVASGAYPEVLFFVSTIDNEGHPVPIGQFGSEADAGLAASAPSDLSWLLAALAQAHRMLAILRQDGTPAQDQARREAKAWCVAWLRKWESSMRGVSAIRHIADALEQEDGP